MQRPATPPDDGSARAGLGSLLAPRLLTSCILALRLSQPGVVHRADFPDRAVHAAHPHRIKAASNSVACRRQGNGVGEGQLGTRPLYGDQVRIAHTCLYGKYVLAQRTPAIVVAEVGKFVDRGAGEVPVQLVRFRIALARTLTCASHKDGCSQKYQWKAGLHRESPGVKSPVGWETSFLIQRARLSSPECRPRRSTRRPNRTYRRRN